MKTIEVRIIGITIYIKLKPFFTFTTLNPTLNFEIWPPWLPPWLKMAASSEYDQPMWFIRKWEEFFRNLNKRNLILNCPFTRTIQIRYGTVKLYLPRNKSGLTSFLSGTASAAAIKASDEASHTQFSKKHVKQTIIIIIKIIISEFIKLFYFDLWDIIELYRDDNN